MSMTAVEPTGINVAGKACLYWVPAIAAPSKPTLAELNAGINLSKILYAWDPNGTQATSERWRYGSETGGQNLGTVTYDPAEVEYDYDPQAPDDADEYAHYAALIPDLSGFLYDRRGLPTATALAAGQFGDVYPAKLGKRLRAAAVASEAASTFHIRQKIVITGEVLQDIEIVAA